MTSIICAMKDCIHRSKKPMRKYEMVNGNKAYKCTLEAIVIVNEAIDEDIYEVTGKELPCCRRYQPNEVKEDD